MCGLYREQVTWLNGKIHCLSCLVLKKWLEFLMKFSTPLFHMLKMPYFPHGAACTRSVTHATQLLAPSTLQSFPKKLIYSNRYCFIHLTVFTASFSPLSSWKLEMRKLHICTLNPMYMSHQELLVFSTCWHLGNILEASGKLSLRFRHSLYIKDVPLLEQLSNCTIKCFFSCCLITINQSKNREPRQI